MRIAQRLLIVAGIIEILIGIMHFTWPFEMIRYSIFAELPDYALDLILLSSLAIGLCLTVFGFLSIYFGYHVKKMVKATMIISLSQAFLWIIRLILEIILPVQLRIFFIESPTLIIRIGIMVLIGLFLISAINLRKIITNATQQMVKLHAGR